MGAAAPEHYALVADGDVAARHSDTNWHGFVEPLGYGKTHGDLPRFLTKHFVPTGISGDQAGRTKSLARSPASHQLETLREYRTFLIKDCGQMTIEGMRADMDTAQRRFDLERLFVPISVLLSPPDIPSTDLDREQKLLRWQEKHRDPRPFGEVFAKHRRLALLALPGGGKTLLLKRLAVAYADSARRSASLDGLPDLDLTPVMIRCREWREHIHWPIPTLLNRMAEVTGQVLLRDLNSALMPRFKQGKVLLLIDGLDEIHDDALRTTFVDHLESFLDDNKLTRLVVTSREAGFSLVAPSLARFCKRWRLSPLDGDGISALCAHWHQLMVGESPEAQREAQEVAEVLLRNDSLRRLAENPLLLTMLLVVKHGAGRLPPDRVSLYGRAVEILLDTWNIKGHVPLSVKEAVPQLAYVAFELMRRGKQTATETELLALLEEARERVPQIRRYAKDTPHEFLKRVELRSSLVVEVGRQMEGPRTVPFYQFRHLTFQEYLAAVAAVEGHYMDYDKEANVLTALQDHLITEEWKEVIPMATVLARKQAEPIVAALVSKGMDLRRQVEADRLIDKSYPTRLPAPIARLVQCLVEEAEASPETLTAALQLIAFFARGCRSDDDWPALVKGAYGNELLSQAWHLYTSRECPRDMWLSHTYGVLSSYQRSEEYWVSPGGHSELLRIVSSDVLDDVGKGLLTYCALLMEHPTGALEVKLPKEVVERHLRHTEPHVLEPAIWAWALSQHARDVRETPSEAVLNRLLSVWLETLNTGQVGTVAAFALSGQAGIGREAWTPTLDANQSARVREVADSHRSRDNAYGRDYDVAASLFVAFHARTIWPDRELANRLRNTSAIHHLRRRLHRQERDPVESMVAQLREAPKNPSRRPTRGGGARRRV